MRLHFGQRFIWLIPTANRHSGTQPCEKDLIIGEKISCPPETSGGTIGKAI